MAFAGFDSELLGALDAAGATAEQTYLLQSVLQSIEGDTFLSQYAAVKRGLAVEVVQAHLALELFSTTGEPKPGLLAALCANAAATCDRAAPHSGGDPLVSALSVTLLPTLAIKKDDAASRAVAAKAAVALEPLLSTLPVYLDRLFARAWGMTAATTDWALLGHAASETACVLAVADRDRRTLQEELAVVLRSAPDCTAVQAVLLPQPARYRYACKVRGACAFNELERLSPGSRHLTGPSGDVSAWGPARPQLGEWLAAQGQEGAAVVIDIEVEARDRASAARLGRRRLVELLDQYMAGHRILRLSLAPVGFACRDAGERPAEEAEHRPVVNRAYPLVTHWPAGLRETLRMSHLARTTDSPMAAVALAWSAIEATGLEPRARGELAGALALQAMRQQVMEAHQHLGQDADSRERYAATRVRASRRAPEKLDAALAKCGPGHRSHGVVLARRNASRDALAVAERRAAEVPPLHEALASVAAHCGLTRHGYLNELNDWVDVLLPAQLGEDATLTDARTALAAALPLLSPLARQQIRDWQQLLADAGRCAAWLQETRRRLLALLDALYAARNLSMHSGTFETRGDAVLARPQS